MHRDVLEDQCVAGLERASHPGARDWHGDVHAAGAGADLGVQNALPVGPGRDGQRSLFAWAIAKRHPERVTRSAADMHAILVHAGGEVEASGLREDVALHEHRVGQRRFTEDPAEQVGDDRMDAQPMQFLIHPEATESGPRGPCRRPPDWRCLLQSGCPDRANRQPPPWPADVRGRRGWFAPGAGRR